MRRALPCLLAARAAARNQGRSAADAAATIRDANRLALHAAMRHAPGTPWRYPL